MIRDAAVVRIQAARRACSNGFTNGQIIAG
jgi:hypothetical protein